MRSFSTSPLVRAIVRRRLFWAPFLIWLMLFAMQDHSLILTVPLLVAVGLEVWLFFGPSGRRSLIATARKLHADLRWFGADLVSWHRPEQAGELAAALSRHGVVCHHLDDRVRSGADLAAALERKFGPRPFPRDPVEKAVAILVGLGTGAGQAHALLLRGGDEWAANDPVGFARFCTLWTEVMAWSAIPLLVFCEATDAPLAPAAAPPSLPRRPARDRAAMIALDTDPSAPGRAPWWVRKPGELLR